MLALEQQTLYFHGYTVTRPITHTLDLQITNLVLCVRAQQPSVHHTVTYYFLVTEITTVPARLTLGVP